MVDLKRIYDAIVVGTGAAGGIAAKELTEGGLERFFVQLKSMTIDGYYTSAIGIHQDLRYKGNRPQAQFLGCTHPEHG